MRVSLSAGPSLGVGTVALLLSACAAVPQLDPSPALRPAKSFAADRSLASPTTTVAAWPDGDWWRGYRDAQLTALIEEGLAGAPDIDAAVARLHQAAGYRQQAGAALLPRVDAGASVSEAKQSYHDGIPEAFVPHGWNGTVSTSASISICGPGTARTCAPPRRTAMQPRSTSPRRGCCSRPTSPAPMPISHACSPSATSRPTQWHPASTPTSSSPTA